MNGNSKRKRERPSARKILRPQTKAKSIVLGVTGSIAAYKAAELASLLVKQGHDVFVVMTKDATEFITPLTLQTLSKNPVTTSFYDEKENWRPGHIELADRADLLAHRAGDGACHRGTGARSRRSSAGRDRARDARADSARTGHERKDVGTSGDEGKRGERWKRAASNSSDRKKECWPAVTKASVVCGKWMTLPFAPSSCSRARII